MSSMAIVVEVVAGGGQDSSVQHQAFAVTYCPPDPWMKRFLDGSNNAPTPEWREDILRSFPLDASDMTVALFAPIPGGTIGYPGGMRPLGLLKTNGTWRWEEHLTSAHRLDIRGVPQLKSCEGMVIGSAWFEFVREVKRLSAETGVQPTSLWCILGVEAMVESLRSSGLRPRVIFWMEGEKHV